MAAERGVGGRAQRVPGTFCGRWRVPGDGAGSGHRWFGAEVHTEHFAIGAGWRQQEVHMRLLFPRTMGIVIDDLPPMHRIDQKIIHLCPLCMRHG